MSAKRQDTQRLKAWRDALYTQLYTFVAPAVFEGFETLDRLTPEQALNTPMHPYPAGTAWGPCWTYGWFRTRLTLPPQVRGQRIIFVSGLGGEQLIYVNGRNVGSIDRQHPYVTLTRSSQGGESFEILIESYAGHGARLENLGPCPPEKKAVPPCPAAQCTVSAGGAAVFHETAYQLLLDVETLMRLAEVLPERSLRAMKVHDALMRFTHTADFELPEPQRTASFAAARDVLRDALACHNGSTAPRMMIFGQSHIDLAWLWPMEETYHKASRTYGNQLQLLQEYPEYRFFACEPALLEMLRAHSPQQFQEVRELVRSGQIFADGAFYVECDTNLPGGESLIRQLMWGKRWFRENLGVESRVAWQPDTFGFTAALPQLLRGFDIPYFATQKLLRADPEFPRFPYQNFLWEGLDGTQVQAVSFFRNNAGIEPTELFHRWERDRTQDEHIETMLFPFGFGDGGGGATRDFVELARRMQDLEGLPRTQYATLEDYCADARESASHNRWVGELYLQWHRGTYSAQRRSKAAMRRLEDALHETEWLLSLLSPEAREPWLPVLREAWRVLMFNQFHDLAAGVGIARVHQEQLQAFHSQLDVLRNACDQIIRALYQETDTEGFFAFNPLAWDVSGVFDLPDGRQVYQTLRAGTATPLLPGADPQDEVRCVREDDRFIMENQYIRAEIDPDGCIVRLADRKTGTEFMDSGMKINEWRLYNQVEAIYDAWEISADYTEGLLPDAIRSEVEILPGTPMRAMLRIRRTFSGSQAEQVLSLDAASRCIRMTGSVSWHERHKMLKCVIQSNIPAKDALHEIQFGQIARPTHRSDAYDQAKYEVVQHRYSVLKDEGRGLAVYNDSIYGVSTDRGEIALTLLRAPLVPDDTCDQGEHTFTYAIEPFTGTLDEAGIVRHAQELNRAPHVCSGTCRALPGFHTQGGAILDTVKPAEDGDGIILRLYEPTGSTRTGTVIFPFTASVQCVTLNEDAAGPVSEPVNAWSYRLAPYQIRTLRLRAVSLS